MRTWRAHLAAGSLATLLVLLTLVNAGSRPASANPIGGLTEISAGDSATCAVTTQGGVTCWGLIDDGGEPSSVPVEVAGLSSGVAAVSAGYLFQCALTDAGGVECWGSNYYGQLGNGTTGRPQDSPVGVRGLESGVAQISAGLQHTCAVMTAGVVKCWGANDFGQLGDGTTRYSTTPVDVVGLPGAVTQISAAVDHTCAVMAAGGVECWGRNDYGQLGDGSATSRLTAVGVSGLGTGAVAVAGADNYSCTISSAGGVKCWGLGYGRTAVDIRGLSDAVAIDAGFSHTCVLTQSGGVKCWGANSLGQLGDSKLCGSICAIPVDVSGLSTGVAAITVGDFHTCALAASGGARCWGNNSWGELGNGSAGGRFIATPGDVVVQEAKPTPTLTPCPPAGCPTPTPRPSPPQTGLDFSIAIDANGDGVPDCGTGADQARECRVTPGGVFQVVVNLNALPPNVPGYGGFDATLNFAGVQSDGTWTPLWPDCGFPARSSDNPQYFVFACAVGIEAPDSSYVGPIGSASFTCNGNGSVTLDHRTNRADGVNGTDMVSRYDTSTMYRESIPGETLAVTCDPLQRGDDNCSRAVNTVDAALTLQLDAKLLDWLGCPQQSDVNLDSVTNAVDALLTKQYDAALVPFLPPQQLGP